MIVSRAMLLPSQHCCLLASLLSSDALTTATTPAAAADTVSKTPAIQYTADAVQRGRRGLRAVSSSFPRVVAVGVRGREGGRRSNTAHTTAFHTIVTH